MVKKEMKKNIEKANGINDSLKKNRKKILVVGSLIVVVLAIAITLFIMMNNKPKLKDVPVTEVISKLEDGSYYIFGADKNKTFEIEKQDGFSYELLDNENKKIELETIDKDNKIILKSKDGYEDGKTYTLKITNGAFVEEELKEAKIVVFNIKRPSKQVVTLKNDIEKKTGEEVKIKEEKDNKFTLETKKDYKKDEIILIDEKAAYKIEECKNNICTASIPTLEEVYSELDYYGAEELNLASFVADKDFKENLKNNIDQNLISMLVPEVNAATTTSLELKYDNKKNELIATVKLSTDPEDKLFGNKFLDNHKFSTTFELGIKITAYQNLEFLNQDVGIVITLRADMGLSISHPAFAKFKEAFEKDFNNDKLVDVRNYVKDAKKDNVDASKKIGGMSVPTGIVGLNVIFNAGYLFEFDLKTDLKANVKNTMTTTIGFSTKKGIYGNIKNKPSATSEFIGEGEVKFGFQGEAGTSLLNIVDIVGKIEVGGYSKGSLSISNKVTNDMKTILKTTGEAGLFGEVKVEGRTAFGKLTHTIFDDKLKLIDIEKKIDAKTILEAKDKPVVKEEEKPAVKPEENKPSNNDNNTKPEEKYYTVSLYYYGCDCEKGTPCLDETIKVKAGDPLSKYKDKWGTSFANRMFTTYDVAVREIKEEAIKNSEREACLNPCYFGGLSLSEASKCVDDCKTKYGDAKVPGEYLSHNFGASTPINKDIKIVEGAMGCGAFEGE